MKDQPLTPAEESLMRWLDEPAGTPPPANDIADEWTRERASTEALGALLRRHAPPPAEPPYPDFFNAQLMKKLRDELPAPAAPRAAAGWREWLRSPWFSGLTAATAAVVVMLALGQHSATAATGETRVVSVFSPEPHARATAMDSRETGAIIIDVTGLENYPEERTLVGLDPSDESTLVASFIP